MLSQPEDRKTLVSADRRPAVPQVEDPLAPREVWAALSSVNARLWAFAGQLRRRGHTVLIAGAGELEQVRSPWRCYLARRV